jgi:hypothetical protein
VSVFSGQVQVATCVAEQYTRHDENGDRTVTRDAYAKEIAQIQAERPNLHAVVYDHTFKGQIDRETLLQPHLAAIRAKFP